MIDVFAPLIWLLIPFDLDPAMAAEGYSPWPQFWDWTIFSLVNVAFWFGVISLIAKVAQRARRT